MSKSSDGMNTIAFTLIGARLFREFSDAERASIATQCGDRRFSE